MWSNVAGNMDKTNEILLGSLNPEQYEAVIAIGRPLLVLSGAGTGKTKVLTTKIAYLIENGYAYASQILAVTFSNRAAREMKERLVGMTNDSQGVWLGTFHSICVRILRNYADLLGMGKDFAIIDADDQKKLVKQILKERNLDNKKVNEIVNKIGLWKDKGIEYNDSRLSKWQVETEVYKIYQERLFSYNSMDFGDLILNTIKIFKDHPHILRQYREKFRYILVDEYQDTNLIQYFWLRLLSPMGEGLCCVGDDDQSIYSWRGAEVEHILRFEKDFPNAQVVRLERNYRSGGHILNAASSLIAHNQSRLGKKIWTEGSLGEKIKVKDVFDGEDEALFVAREVDSLRRKENCSYKDMVVLVRAGYQTRLFEDSFISRGIPYKVVGGLKFYDRQEIKDIIAYMRLVFQPGDGMALERIINVPKRGIGASSIAKIHSFAVDRDISLYQAMKIMLSEGLLRAGIKKELTQFIDLIDSLRMKKRLKPVDIAKEILVKTGYLDMLKKENTPESSAREENIKELISALEGFSDLQAFMEHVSLVMDSPKDTEQDDTVSIMTLHGSKGLEFENVFLVGWEEGVFPHMKCYGNEAEMEEERRLAYVGLTRTKKRAYVIRARRRLIFGQWQDSRESRFLREIPWKNIERI